MAASELVFLNISGNILTDKTKPLTAYPDLIDRMAKEVADAISKKKDMRLMIGTGAGSYGHPLAQKYNLIKGVKPGDPRGLEGIALCQDSTAKLHRMFIAAMLKYKVPVFSVQPSSAAIAKEGKIYSFFTDHLKEMMDLGMVPVIYGDVLIDLEQGCAVISTEAMARYLSKYFRFDRVIVATRKEGIFSEDPEINPNATFYTRIDSKNLPYIKHLLETQEGIDVTGGMRERVEKCYELARAGAHTIIISGLVENRLRDALLGKEVKGTVVAV